jgi:acyl carrier protein
MTDSTDHELRLLIAELLGEDPSVILAMADDTPILAGGLGLSSLNGARLLVQVRDRLGVDVAAEDLFLRSLESLGALSQFISERRTADRSSG